MKSKSDWQIKSESAWMEAAGPASGDDVMRLTISTDFHAKQGRSTGKLQFGGGRLSIYLKRHWQLPLFRRLLAWWRPTADWSPAAVEWKNLHWARQHGFRVPEPLAMGQWIGPGLQIQSYLAIRELTGMLPLHQAIPEAHSLLSREKFTAWKKQLLSDVADIARRLHALHHFHQDLYLCHFYVARPIATATHPGELALIDLHRLQHHRWVPLYPLIKDLAQLYFSTWGVNGIDDQDRSELMKAYFAGSLGSMWQRMVHRAVLAKAHRYLQHNQRMNEVRVGENLISGRAA